MSDSPEAGVTGDYEPSKVGAGNRSVSTTKLYMLLAAEPPSLPLSCKHFKELVGAQKSQS